MNVDEVIETFVCNCHMHDDLEMARVRTEEGDLIERSIEELREEGVDV